jgi:hypothetical protein
MRLEVPRTYLHLHKHKQAIKPRKGGREDREVDIIITLISLVEKKESKSLRIACPIPPPLPACLRVAARGLQLLPSAAGRLLFSLSPPGIPSSSRVDRGSQGWTQQARSVPVGGLVWSGLARAGERERERERERDEERKRSASGVVFAL